MNQTDFDRYVKYLISKSADILVAKGADYAGGADRLANFKRGAELTGATPTQVAFVYLSKHYDAIATYVRETSNPVQVGTGYAPSEPIEGRLLDLINYCFLLASLIYEETCKADFAKDKPR